LIYRKRCSPTFVMTSTTLEVLSSERPGTGSFDRRHGRTGWFTQAQYSALVRRYREIHVRIMCSTTHAVGTLLYLPMLLTLLLQQKITLTLSQDLVCRLPSPWRPLPSTERGLVLLPRHVSSL
jgi:hypothetical protein